MARPLQDMTLEELWELFPIVLTEHQPCWIAWFKEEAAELRRLLPEASAIHHIGSTAVPGIWAKPIVDILVMLPDAAALKNAKETLVAHGYLCMAEDETRISFNEGYTERGFAERVFHIHLRLPGDDAEVSFRDYLQAHPEVAQEYEALKLSLWKRFEHDRDGYTAAKTEFITRITALAQEAPSKQG